MGNFPPTYDYPRVLTAKGDRLHPGTVLLLNQGGVFAFGVLWRVLAPVEGAAVHPLRLQCVTMPAVVVDLPERFHGCDIQLVRLSSFFKYEDFAGYYGGFQQLGYWLYAEESEREGPFRTKLNAVHVTGRVQAYQEVSLWEIEHLPNSQQLILQYFYDYVKREGAAELAKTYPALGSPPPFGWSI